MIYIGFVVFLQQKASAGTIDDKIWVRADAGAAQEHGRW